jgi:hypothetical protein
VRPNARSNLFVDLVVGRRSQYRLRSLNINSDLGFVRQCTENVGKTSLLIALKAFFQHGFKKKKNTLASRRATVVAETKKKELESKGGQATGDTLSTDGIDIETLQYNSTVVAASDGSKEKDKSKDDKKGANPTRNITFSCWDFGGMFPPRFKSIFPSAKPVELFFFFFFGSCFRCLALLSALVDCLHF